MEKDVGIKLLPYYLCAVHMLSEMIINIINIELGTSATHSSMPLARGMAAVEELRCGPAINFLNMHTSYVIVDINRKIFAQGLCILLPSLVM